MLIAMCMCIYIYINECIRTFNTHIYIDICFYTTPIEQLLGACNCVERIVRNMFPPPQCCEGKDVLRTRRSKHLPAPNI